MCVLLKVHWNINCGMATELIDLFSIYYQAAVYGIGVCAEFGGTKFKTIVGGSAKV